MNRFKKLGLISGGLKVNHSLLTIIHDEPLQGA
jgi:hypothetical protein